MRALALEHLHSNPIGVYGDILLEQGIGVDRILLDRGERPPDWREYDLLVVMGGGMSAYQEAEYPWLAEEKRLIADAVDSGMPFFGVCLGSQLLAASLGARVYRGPEPELGVDPMFMCEPARRDPVFRGFPIDIEVFQWHCDTFDLPEGAARLARSPRYENEAFHFGPVAYAIQFHLETSIADLQDWLAAWPSLADTFENRHGPGAVDAFLQEYAAAVPHLRRTAAQLFRRWLENALVQRTSRTSDVGARVDPHAQDLIGRDHEQRRIATLLDRARSGQGGALLLLAEPGLGKTALLDLALDLAAGMNVVRVAGIDDELELPHAGLCALCGPLLSYLDQLPERQARAIAAALGIGAAAVEGDRFASYTAAAALHSAAARERPLLVCIDDADLLDDPSLEAVAVLARRLEGEPIALLVASAGGVLSALGDAEAIELAPLDRSQARHLLTRHFGDELSPRVVAEVIDLARGNPLALLEIPHSLTPTQRSDPAELSDALRVRASAEQAFLERISGLSQDARTALLAAALVRMPEVRMSVLEPVLAALGINPAVLEEAEFARLVVLEDGEVRFRHDLVRSTVIYGALRAERRAVHAALAETLDLEPERIAWHRALAAAEPDETVARALASAGGVANDRRAHATAARMLELAARLSPAPPDRARRLVAAGHAASLAGHAYAAIDHIETALPDLDDRQTRTEADHLLGVVLARSGSAARARSVLVEGAALSEPNDAHAAAKMLADAVIPALRAGSPEEACAIGERALRLSGSAGDANELRTSLMLGIALVFTGELDRGQALVFRARELSEAGVDADPRLRGYLGLALRLVGEHEAARDVLTSLADEARWHGAIGILAYVLVRLANVDLDTGRWQDARTALLDAAALARETGQAADLGLASGALAWLAAVQGRENECRERARVAIELAERLGAGSRLDLADQALGLLALAAGDPEGAVDCLGRVRRLKLEQGWCDAAIQPHCAPDLVEALASAGRLSEARRELDVFLAEVRRCGRSSALAAARRCEGFLAPESSFHVHFDAALEVNEPTTGPFERARTELWYARRLRATDTSGADVMLRSALDTLSALEAEPWVAVTRAELSSSGACGLSSPAVPGSR